ncbi:MAG: type I methionyl aminopeptidase [Candidatus Omnitrophica bacterium CG08_land_8_20_14_0_20_41_16]|uniref:Methionine aminopeptidase n=1 Tax=Candidatus Sherwoodlollariibacterium unditelluris TaxID=1974757 RepID=A0A2G9YHE0_9BACT|nr:MAG: type I methionyl aminopeptidase [Candidatus Omnitrophica bacterium CG23_combo_of_CG06-09_8_20_14_all_41_10]PIS33815.1 MAG: type I methionyl aminopeptidase [Candidatus Omnitrophica bacterium CG08_land_8_20_14_0_20_41_16]
MVPLKSEEDLKMLQRSGQILGRVMKGLEKIVNPGISTLQIDRLAEELIVGEGAKPAFKGYQGFPAAICASINEEIVHGIPGKRVLEEGDIISLDLGVNLSGYFSDAAITLAVGKISPEVMKLIQVTREALAEGIKKAIIGNNLSDVSHRIQSFVEGNGFSVVRQFVGHGIGKNLHEEPEIPNFGRPHQGPILKKGMVLAIEPMVNMGSWESEILPNGWTAVTKDRQVSAHFEHTIALTEEGPVILTG